MVRIGETIKELRRKKELTQENLANFLGVSFQCISKWERGESYPDITIIPSIASFFGVSTDHLLGVDENKRQEKIKQYQTDYSRLWSENKKEEARDVMKKAVVDFPGDYDLLVRYLNCLISVDSSSEYICGIKEEVLTVYEMIQNNCKVDSIRIWAKKLVCRYLKNLSVFEANSNSLEKAELIISEMPLMQNCRDYYSVFFYRDDKDRRESIVGTCLNELIKMLGDVIYSKYDYPWQCDEKVIKAYIGLVESVMQDGDYGKSYINIIDAYSILSVKLFENGEKEEAISMLKNSLLLAKNYDCLTEETIQTSELVRGIHFNKAKTTIGKGSMFERERYMIENVYPLSEDIITAALTEP